MDSSRLKNSAPLSCETQDMDGDSTWVSEQIGGYRVLRLLGRGGMGEVYLVGHPRLPRQDALKLLETGFSRNDEFRRRFEREADLLAPLRHPNIITLYDRGDCGGRLWLTMEYVAGTDASRLLKERGALPFDLTVQIIEGTGAALDYAYSEYGITHRDVKPANILVEFDRHGRLKAVKLADFGIAKAVGEATSLTSTGSTVGTMSYLPPEAIEGRGVDNRADIYSLGCSAFQMLTGTLPFAASSIPALMMAHVAQPVPSITERNPALPKYLDVVFAKVLAKNPNDRFQSCHEFVSVLRSAGPDQRTHVPLPARQAPTRHVDVETALAATSPSVSALVSDPGQPGKRRWSRLGLTALGAAVVTTVAVVAGVLALRSSESHPQAPAESTSAVAAPPTSGVAQTATSPESKTVDLRGLSGVWVGTYICTQGETAVQLSISPGDTPDVLNVLQDFGPTPNNPNVPRGENTMTASMVDGNLLFVPGKWINQPEHYISIPISIPGPIDVQTRTLSGRRLGAGCTTLTVTR